MLVFVFERYASEGFDSSSDVNCTHASKTFDLYGLRITEERVTHVHDDTSDRTFHAVIFPGTRVSILGRTPPPQSRKGGEKGVRSGRKYFEDAKKFV